MPLHRSDRTQGSHEEGQALVEYALILAFVALVCILALTALGANVAAALDEIAAGL